MWPMPLFSYHIITRRNWSQRRDLYSHHHSCRSGGLSFNLLRHKWSEWWDSNPQGHKDAEFQARVATKLPPYTLLKLLLGKFKGQLWNTGRHLVSAFRCQFFVWQTALKPIQTISFLTNDVCCIHVIPLFWFDGRQARSRTGKKPLSGAHVTNYITWRNCRSVTMHRSKKCGWR